MEKINDDELENVAGGGRGRLRPLYGVYCNNCKKLIADYGTIGSFQFDEVKLKHHNETGHWNIVEVSKSRFDL